MSDLVVHVIPHHDHKNWYYPMSRLVTSGEHLIHDTADMVSQLQTLVLGTLEFSRDSMAPRVRPTGQVHNIARLIITGHGTPTSFRIGSDRVTLPMLQNANHSVTQQLTQIAPLFTASAVVVLRSCRTGQSQPLMQALSRVLGGVRVQGSEDTQYGPIPGLIGDLVECTLDTCSTVD